MELSSLAKLPAELRNEIYKFVLYEPEGIHLHTTGATWTALKRFDPVTARKRRLRDYCKHSLAITKTCKQIKKESHIHFFAVNTFYMRQLDALRAETASYWMANRYEWDLRLCRVWLELIGPHHAKAIKAVVMGRELIPAWCIGYELSRPVEHLRWNRLASKMERERLGSALPADKIYRNVRILLEQPETYPTYFFAGSFRGGRLDHGVDALSMDLLLSSTDQSLALEEIAAKFSEKEAELAVPDELKQYKLPGALKRLPRRLRKARRYVDSAVTAM